MLFNSISFLIFFPIVVIVYFLIPQKARWIWLLVSSYYFYMSWNPEYALLLLTSTAITYLSGILISNANRMEDEKKKIFYKKLWLALSVISNLGILFFFKYFNFALDNINYFLARFNMEAISPAFDVILPVGISFYTFQALSYTFDIYRKEITAEKNFGKYALFVSFFPQLVAGPIERSKNLLKQFSVVHTFDPERVRSGLLLMAWGFFQKLVIADRVSILVNQAYNNYANYNGSAMALATVLFAVQIYCDFSGYSDIAIGAARVMGFDLMRNFNRPYLSVSIRDFWRRWHISLSSWFRDYLYISLGGNRCSKPKQQRNILITFLASGLWHGASWNFAIWGAIHGLYILIGGFLTPAREKVAGFLRIGKHPAALRAVRIAITFFLVNFAWVFFRAADLNASFSIIRSIFSNQDPSFFLSGSLFSLGLDYKDFIVIAASIVIMIIVGTIRQNAGIKNVLEKRAVPVRWLIYFCALFFVIVFGVYGPGYDAGEFIYFQF